MKCLKSSKTGEIIRVSNEKADASTSEWKFIPKSEWKAQFPKKKEVSEVAEAAAVSLKTIANYEADLTISERQLKRKK